MKRVRWAVSALVIGCVAHAEPFLWVPAIPIEWGTGAHVPAAPGTELTTEGPRWGVLATGHDADVGASGMTAGVAFSMSNARVGVSVGQFGVPFYREQRASLAIGRHGVALLLEARRVIVDGVSDRRGLGWGVRVLRHSSGLVAAVELSPRVGRGDATLFGTSWCAHVGAAVRGACVAASVRANAGEVRLQTRVAWQSDALSVGLSLDPADGTIGFAVGASTRGIAALAGVTWQSRIGGRRWAALVDGSS